MNQGIYPIFKPKGISSFKIIAILRRITGVKKIGHAGTLDPLASGVLVVAIGKEFTKQISTHVKKNKTYNAEIILGLSSTTDDEEGIKKIVEPISTINLAIIKTALKQFEGTIKQTPPAFSAIKIKGQPAYKKARLGISLDLKPRQVRINRITLISFRWPLLAIEVDCGPGVYIRSLARDLGQKLGTAAYLHNLVRTKVGEFSIEDCINLPAHYFLYPPKIEDTADNTRLKSIAHIKESTTKSLTKN